MTAFLTTRGQHGGAPDTRPGGSNRVLEAVIILELVVLLALVAAYIVMAIA